jgi:hypothetical protein
MMLTATELGFFPSSVPIHWVSAITAKLQAVADGLAREPNATGCDVPVGVELPLSPHAVSAKSATVSATRFEYFHTLFFILGFSFYKILGAAR